jgi:hypothetical protein
MTSLPVIGAAEPGKQIGGPGKCAASSALPR